MIRGRMARGRLAILLALAAVLAAAGLSLAQDAVMFINDDALGPHQRPLVRFTHEKHAENIECVTCHHDPDQYFNNKGPQEGMCTDCHQAVASGDNRVSLQDAMHQRCKGCHQGMIDRGFASGPVTCGACHVRGAAPAEGKAEKKG